MAKTKGQSKIPACDEVGASSCGELDTVPTIHGENISVSMLRHIAKPLQQFAVRIGTVKRDPQNARKHGTENLAQIAESLASFKQVQPILFHPETRILISGNGRHEAAQSILEWEYIAAMPFDGTLAEAEALGLVDNRTSETSEWDPEKLAAKLDALRDAKDSTDIHLPDLDKLGFSADDMKALDEMFEDKTKKKATAVEAKQSESVSGKFFNIVIKCGSERHQLELLEALTERDTKRLVKLLNGADVRTQN